MFAGKHVTTICFIGQVLFIFERGLKTINYLKRYYSSLLVKYLINCLKISGKIFHLMFHINRNTLLYNVMYLSAVHRLHKTRN